MLAENHRADVREGKDRRPDGRDDSRGPGGRWGQPEQGCEGGSGAGPGRKEGCSTRRRPEAEGREDNVPGAGGQRAELPARKEQQAACGPAKVRGSRAGGGRCPPPPPPRQHPQGASSHRHLCVPI